MFAGEKWLQTITCLVIWKNTYQCFSVVGRFAASCAIKRWEIEAQVWFIIMTVKQQLKLKEKNLTPNIIRNYPIESCRDANISHLNKNQMIQPIQHDLIAPVRGIFGSTWRIAAYHCIYLSFLATHVLGHSKDCQGWYILASSILTACDTALYPPCRINHWKVV